MLKTQARPGLRSRARREACRPIADPQRTSADEPPRVAEQPHPTAVFARIGRTPGVLHVTEGPLRMRHRNGHAAVEVAERRDPERRAAGIERITAGHAAVV